ncbi:hypothetical protein NECAME_16732, partial [Necator americanus]
QGGISEEGAVFWSDKPRRSRRNSEYWIPGRKDMPAFEVSLITRSLSKSDLIKALVRAGNVLLDHGAVVEYVKSLGFRDLPYKRVAKQTREPIYASNTFLFHTHMSNDARNAAKSILLHDLDMAVKELREGQKMGHFTRQMIYKRTEKEWKSIPKSYAIAPPRP